MRWKESALFLLLVAGVSLCHSDKLITIDERTTIVVKYEGVAELEYAQEHEEPLNEYGQETAEDLEKQESLNNSCETCERVRRQTTVPTYSFLNSVSQECNGITLRWNSGPNIPYSVIFHNDNPEFRHYNIYREKNFFATVLGLTPLASGKHIEELRHITTDKWTDTFPPSGIDLFYALTVVNHKGKETEFVVPKQITFYGGIKKADLNPIRITPSSSKGDVLHHSVAYNSFRNEYMVVFDTDVNKDGKPDHIYVMRVNSSGEVIDKIKNATVKDRTTEQGHPSVAFNPFTKKYMVVHQITLHSNNMNLIVGHIFHSATTERYRKPYMLVRSERNNESTYIREPKLVYNSKTGGFVMTVFVDTSPMAVLVAFVHHGGNITFLDLLPGNVFDVNVFIDTKAKQVYFILQGYANDWRWLIPSAKQHQTDSYQYAIVAVGGDATGQWIGRFNPSTEFRHVVGFTNAKRASITGFFNQKKRWLNLFWNNKVNRKTTVSSTTIVPNRGAAIRVENMNNCPGENNIHDPATCYLRKNNVYILLWEKGEQIGGNLVTNDIFHPVSGEQRQPKLVCNEGEGRAFVVWKQKIRGRFALFIRNIMPQKKCVIENVCASKNPVWSTPPSCAKNNGGCSQECRTTVSFANETRRLCSCEKYYALALDEMKCNSIDKKPDVSLLYSSQGSIWSVSIYYGSKRTSYIKIPIQGKNIFCFFYNKKDAYLYWADAEERKIYRAFLNGTNKQLLVDKEIILPVGMIVDPDANQLYWTDEKLGVIFRSSLDGSNKIRFVSSLAKPRALALVPNKWLFWTTVGNAPKIERINMDGSNKRDIISNGLGSPNGLALNGSELYWVDANNKSIDKSDENGGQRAKIVETGLDDPFGLALVGSRFFWTDWVGEIKMVDKDNPSDFKVVVTGIKKPYSLQIYDGLAQDKATLCPKLDVPGGGTADPKPVLHDGKYQVGNTVLFTCKPGYKHFGSTLRICLPNGKWSGVNAHCKVLPYFTTFPTDITTKVGQPVTLKCSANNLDGTKPNINWYKNGKVIPDSNRRYYRLNNGYLVLFYTFPADTGKYTCEARNKAGEIQTSMFLNVGLKTQLFKECGIVKHAGGTRNRLLPWQVLLWKKGEKHFHCGGVLLTERWIITAAHCFLNKSNHYLSKIKVVPGKEYWKNKSYSIETVHEHPKYNYRILNSDITLVKLKNRITMNNYLKPVCLPFKKRDQDLLKPGKVGLVSGWAANTSTWDNPLHQVHVSVVSKDICLKAFPGSHLTSNMFCAGYQNSGSGSCNSDSGGPLTMLNPHTKRAVLMGTISWGTEICAGKGKIGVYVKIQNYLDWIRNTIKH